MTSPKGCCCPVILLDLVLRHLRVSFQRELRVVVRDHDDVGFNVALYEGSEMQNRDRKLDDSTRLEPALLEAKPLSGAERLGAGEGRLGSRDKPRGSNGGDRLALLLQQGCGLLEGSTLFQLLRKDNKDPAFRESISDLLVLALEGQETARNERHVIQLHVASSECLR